MWNIVTFVKFVDCSLCQLNISFNLDISFNIPIGEDGTRNNLNFMGTDIQLTEGERILIGRSNAPQGIWTRVTCILI